MKTIALIFIILLFGVFTLTAQRTLYQPDNMNFERGTAEFIPPGWNITRETSQFGFSAMITLNNPASGNQAAMLIDDDPKSRFLSSSELNQRRAYLFQSIDALSYRNKTVKFRAAIRANIEDTKISSAYLFLESRTVQDTVDFIYFTANTPSLINEWQYFEIEAKIPAGSNMLRYGLVIQGTGTAWLDDASLDFVQPANSQNISSIKLDAIKIDRLAYFADMYGLLRYFNPSASAINTDWERFLLKGIDYSLSANSETIWADSLNNLFRAVSNKVFLTSNNSVFKNTDFTPSEQSSVPKSAFAFYHFGGFSIRPTQHSYTEIKNVYEAMPEREAIAIRTMAIPSHNGKYISYKAKAKVEAKTAGSGARIQLRADDRDNNILLALYNEEYPMQNTDWEEYKIVAEILDAVSVRIGMSFYGEGHAYFDDLILEILDENFEPTDTLFITDFRTDNLDNPPRAWQIPESVTNANYTIKVTNEEYYKNSNSVFFMSDPKLFIDIPPPGYNVSREYDNNTYFKLQIAQFADEHPISEISSLSLKLDIKGKPEGYVINSEDVFSRIAIIIEYWNILKHFSLKNLTEAELFKLLKEAITATSTQSDNFVHILDKLIYASDDIQSKIWQGYNKEIEQLPFTMKYINEKIIVTQSDVNNSELKPGDIVTNINGVDSKVFIEQILKNKPGENKYFTINKALTDFRRENKNVVLNIERENKNIKNIKEKAFVLSRDLPSSKPNFIDELAPGIVYIDMTTINDQYFKELINDLNTYKGIVFDLRGITQMSVHVLGLFSKNNYDGISFEIPIYTYPDKYNVHYKNIPTQITANRKLSHIKPIFLIDETTLGYSESIAATVQFNKIGTLVGSETAGQPGEISFYRLPGDYHLTMTSVLAYYPDGKQLTKPISPDVEVIPLLNDIKNYEDSLINKAIEILQR